MLNSIKNPENIYLQIPPRFNLMQPTLDFVEKLSEETGFSYEEQKQLRLALEETMLFIMKTADLEKSSTPLDLVIECGADSMTLHIIEYGLPIDIKNLPEYNPSADDNEFPDEALNLHIARKVMDSLVFYNKGRGGIEIEMKKNISSRHINSRINSSEIIGISEKSPASHEIESDPEKYKIRLMQEYDALEIARCAYLTYGYTYEDYIYYPDKIIEYNKKRKMVSYVITTPDDLIVGHAALKLFEDQPALSEYGVLFVKPEYRKIGLARYISRKILDCAVGLDKESVIGRTVTGHKASQLLFKGYGFKETGLFLGLFPRGVNLKSIGGEQEGKMSGVVQWLYLKPPAKKYIYISEQYRDIVTKLYTNLEIPFEIIKRSNTYSDECLVNVERVQVMNIANIEVLSIGRDFDSVAKLVLGTIRKLCAEKMDTVYIHINCDDPFASELMDVCSQAGAVFSGIFPSSAKYKNAVILQYLNMPDDPFSHLEVCTETAAMLRDYILDEYKKK